MKKMGGLKRALSLALAFCLFAGVLAFLPENVFAASAKKISTASELKKAFTSGKGGSYKLTKDIRDFGKGIKVSGGTYKLDLNGHSIIGSDSSWSLLYVAGADLTIGDSSAGAKGSITNKTVQDAVGCKSGSLTIEGGNYKGQAYAVYVEGGEVTVNGGTMTGEETGIKVYGGKLTLNDGTVKGSGTRGYGIIGNSPKKSSRITINGGKIKGAWGVYTTNTYVGKVRMTGGNITAEWTGIFHGGGTLDISGGKIVATDGRALEIRTFDEDVPKVTISDGTFSGKGDSGVGLYLENPADVRITGGKFAGTWLDMFVGSEFEGVLEYPPELFTNVMDNSRQGMGVTETEFERVDIAYTPGMRIEDKDTLYSLCVYMMENLKKSAEFETDEHLYNVFCYYKNKWFDGAYQNLSANCYTDEYGNCSLQVKVTYQLDFQVMSVLRNPDLSGNASKKANKYASRMLAIKKKIIKNGMTRKQKIKAVHDYMIKTYSYDYSFKEDSYYFYGMLDNKKGVCQAYATLFQMFMEMLDIRCECVTGWAASAPNATDYEAHMWNRILLSGKWYYIDVTFDDTSGSNKFYMLTAKKFYGLGLHKL